MLFSFLILEMAWVEVAQRRMIGLENDGLVRPEIRLDEVVFLKTH